MERRKKDQRRWEQGIIMKCLRDQYIQGREKAKQPILTLKR